MEEHHLNVALIPPKTLYKNFTQYKSYFVPKNSSNEDIKLHNMVQYIGMTKRNLHVRMSKHVRDGLSLMEYSKDNPYNIPPKDSYNISGVKMIKKMVYLF